MLKAAWTMFFALLLTTTAFSFSDTSPAAFERQAKQIRAKLKDRGFTVIVERPFIVIGDEPDDRVALWAKEIIRGTVTRLKQDYFAKDPINILEIWLFKDEASYRKHAKEFFDDEPDTPYGYYSPSKKTLIMNIATGGGTLVHEIVHPFVEANFPDSPAWFNEGLGSLYEQSGTVNGHIYGYTNWRLRGLQNGLRTKIVPTFKAMTSMTDGEFYREATGTNYAQARYLCYYLQEKGLLRKFYKEFVANAKTDPTGYETLQRVLAERNMTAFQRKWEAFVMKLTF
ncbi:MAG: hypothetical protein IPG58_05400 [Acidobacteria bacterium]|nr:hypothetical protein [Acidobacteriota bacterium]